MTIWVYLCNFVYWKKNEPKYMKILFVLENFYPNIGGVETLFKSLTEQLVREGHEVMVITTRLNDDMPAEENLNGVQIRRYPFFNRYTFTLFAVFPIMRHIRQYDIVHTTSYNAGLPAYITSKLFRKKVVITFHEVWGKLWFELPYMGRIAKWGHYLFEQMLTKFRYDKFIAVSHSTADSMRENDIAEKRIATIYNGLDYERIDRFDRKIQASEDKRPFTYTYYGRLGISKGLDILLDAATILNKKHPDTRLKIIIPTTPESLFKNIIKTIKKHHLENHIELKHHLSSEALVAELKNSDCVVIPSYSEGFCYVAVESIALGIPVISSDKKALKEVISGKYIKMNEFSANDLFISLEKAMRNEWQNVPVKKFELKNTVAEYIDLYHNI